MINYSKYFKKIYDKYYLISHEKLNRNYINKIQKKFDCDIYELYKKNQMNNNFDLTKIINNLNNIYSIYLLEGGCTNLIKYNKKLNKNLISFGGNPTNTSCPLGANPKKTYLKKSLQYHPDRCNVSEKLKKKYTSIDECIENNKKIFQQLTEDFEKCKKMNQLIKIRMHKN